MRGFIYYYKIIHHHKPVSEGQAFRYQVVLLSTRGHPWVLKQLAGGVSTQGL